MERIIIGIPLSPDTQREIERVCFGVPNIEWLEPSSMHITIKYLGNISGSNYIDLKELLLTVQFPPFTYTLEGLTVRHSKHKNGSFQIPILSNPQLETLTKEIEKLLKPLQLEQSKQLTAFHVTIGYFHNLRPQHLQNFIEANTYFQSTLCQANEICILSHHRTPKITYYSIEESYPLNKYNAPIYPKKNPHKRLITP